MDWRPHGTKDEVASLLRDPKLLLLCPALVVAAAAVGQLLFRSRRLVGLLHLCGASEFYIFFCTRKRKRRREEFGLVLVSWPSSERASERMNLHVRNLMIVGFQCRKRAAAL